MEVFLQILPWALLGIILMLILIGLWTANFAYDAFARRLEENLQIETSFWGNTFEFANYVSKTCFQDNIKVQIINTADGCYVPANLCVCLGQSFANSQSIAGIAIAAHEFGHAAQHLQNPKILINHHKFNRLVQFLGNINWVILIASVLAMIFASVLWGLVGAGLLILNVLIAIGLKYYTLQVEKDASRRAMEIIAKLEFFPQKEMQAIKKFLGYAKRTYTADFLAALLGWTGLVRKTKFF